VQSLRYGISSSGTIAFSGFAGANNGGAVFANASGVLSQTGAGNSSQCLLGGATPSFGSCGTGVTTICTGVRPTELSILITLRLTSSSEDKPLPRPSLPSSMSIPKSYRLHCRDLILRFCPGDRQINRCHSYECLQLGNASTGDLIFAPNNAVAMTIKNGVISVSGQLLLHPYYPSVRFSFPGQLVRRSRCRYRD